MSPASRRNVIRTLVINGYVLEQFETPTSGASLIRVWRTDALGAKARSILLFANSVSNGLHNRLTGDAQRHNATPMVIATGRQIKLRAPTRVIHLREFYQLLGGEVQTDRIFDPKLKSILRQLGHNRVPEGFSGTADDLLEAYCKEALQFLLECPVRRYGQERRFEKLPDGLALAKNKFNLCFDAKAYKGRFHPSANDIRQFVSYVRDLNDRYSDYIGPLALILVITGSLSVDERAIKNKVDDFFAECSIPMVFMKAEDLAVAVQLTRSAGRLRRAINWRRMLVPYVFDIRALRAELTRIRKDAVVN